MKSTIWLSCVAACGLLGPVAAIADAGTNTDRAGAPVVISDSAITSSIKAHFQSEHSRQLRHVRVDTDGHGVVSLKGHTKTQEAADRAVAIARDTQGVREVRSGIEIKHDD